MAISYRAMALKDTNNVAKMAETRKMAKYSILKDNYYFMPIAVETLGGWLRELCNF